MDIVPQPNDIGLTALLKSIESFQLSISPVHHHDVAWVSQLFTDRPIMPRTYGFDHA
ncbi:hypothetical protein D3C73_1568960 [compost metagenome]